MYALCAVCIHEKLSFLYAWASLRRVVNLTWKCICVFFIVARFHRNPHWPKAKYVTFSGPAGRLRLGRRCTICHESLQILAVIWDEVLIHSCLQGPEWLHTLDDIAMVKTHLENISRSYFSKNKALVHICMGIHALFSVYFRSIIDPDDNLSHIFTWTWRG